MVEEKQIALTLDNALIERDQAYLTALKAASDAYIARIQKVESRLIAIREMLTREGEWTEPKQASPLGPVMG